MDKYPVLVKQENDQKVFSSEREILYQVLFDMKKDVNDLKKLVHDIMSGNIQPVAPNTTYTQPIQTATVTPMPTTANVSTVTEPPIQEAETVEDESLSLEDAEKTMIRKALERHGGRRKSAAADLKISERTLYRKIKEYGLE